VRSDRPVLTPGSPFAEADDLLEAARRDLDAVSEGPAAAIVLEEAVRFRLALEGRTHAAEVIQLGGRGIKLSMGLRSSLRPNGDVTSRWTMQNVLTGWVRGERLMAGDMSQPSYHLSG